MKASFVFAGKSALGKYSDPVRQDFDRLNREVGERRITAYVWPEDSQDIGLARHQPRLIKFIQDSLLLDQRS